MNSLKILLAALLIFTFFILSGNTQVAKSEVNDGQVYGEMANNTQVYEYIDGHWYIITYDMDGKMVDQEILD